MRMNSSNEDEDEDQLQLPDAYDKSDRYVALHAESKGDDVAYDDDGDIPDGSRDASFRDASSRGAFFKSRGTDENRVSSPTMESRKLPSLKSAISDVQVKKSSIPSLHVTTPEANLPVVAKATASINPDVSDRRTSGRAGTRTEKIAQRDEEVERQKAARAKRDAKKMSLNPQNLACNNATEAREDHGSDGEDEMCSSNESEERESEERENTPKTSDKTASTAPQFDEDSYDDLNVSAPLNHAQAAFSSSPLPSSPTESCSNHGSRSASRSSNTPTSSALGKRVSERSSDGEADSPPAKQPRVQDAHQAPNSCAASGGHGVGRKKGKPSFGDFDDDTAHVLSLACFDYKAFMAVAVPFPSGAEAVLMPQKSWERANQIVYPNGPGIEYTDRIKRVIIQRASQFRGFIRDQAAPIIAQGYGLSLCTSDDVRSHNRYMVHMLRKNSAFTRNGVVIEAMPADWPVGTLQNEVNDSGYLEKGDLYAHFVIRETICRVLFRNSEDYGIVFSDWFQPIPLVTIALVVTIIEHCLEEYSSGIRVPKKLDANVCSARFAGHLSNLQKFEKRTPRKCKRLLDFISRTARARALVNEDLSPKTTATLSDADFGEDLPSDEEDEAGDGGGDS